MTTNKLYAEIMSIYKYNLKNFPRVILMSSHPRRIIPGAWTRTPISAWLAMQRFHCSCFAKRPPWYIRALQTIFQDQDGSSCILIGQEDSPPPITLSPFRNVTLSVPVQLSNPSHVLH